MTLTDALSRTLLLMRADLDSQVEDAELLDALTSVRVVLQVGADALATHSGQSAVVAAALTIARSGHEVWIDGADVAKIGPQPPLGDGRLLESVEAAGRDLLPGRSIRRGVAPDADLIVLIGDATPAPDAGRVAGIDATDWTAKLTPQPVPWSGSEWPLGAIGAAALVASEAFRIAMRRLAGHARDPGFFDELYAPSSEVSFALAPTGTPMTASLPDFDFVSGGAIANAALFAVARLPGVTGNGRVLDDDRSALSNLNRNAMLLRSALDIHKVEDLARHTGRLAIAPDAVRYVAGMGVATTVLVGVDDIPSRWAVQAAGPRWLGVGATEGFAVLVSSHAPGQPCAGCLHPVAATPEGPIPTAAFVSLLSGLFLVARWQRSLGPEGGALADQQTFLNALRPEGWRHGSMPVAVSADCPVGCAASNMRKVA